MAHIYKELTQGEEDLRLFSGMYANEGEVMYLVDVSGGTEITKEMPTDVKRIEAVGINGVLFTR